MKKNKKSIEYAGIKVTKVKNAHVKPIPPFKTLQEEADFWGTHDLLDDVDEGTMVGFHAANKDTVMSVRFEKKDIEALRRQAFHIGVGPTTLVRMWIREKLHSAR